MRTVHRKACQVGESARLPSAHLVKRASFVRGRPHRRLRDRGEPAAGRPATPSTPNAEALNRAIGDACRYCT